MPNVMVALETVEPALIWCEAFKLCSSGKQTRSSFVTNRQALGSLGFLIRLCDKVIHANPCDLALAHLGYPKPKLEDAAIS